MQTIKALAGMNILDASMQSSGSAEDFFAFAKINGLGYTDALQVGNDYQVTGLKYVAGDGIIIAVTATNKNIRVLKGQCVIDIAIQESGSAEDSFNVARLNGISVTDVLQVGQLMVTPSAPYNLDVYNALRAKAVKPATVDVLTRAVIGPQGIGFWTIENDFIVS